MHWTCLQIWRTNHWHEPLGFLPNLADLFSAKGEGEAIEGEWVLGLFLLCFAADVELVLGKWCLAGKPLQPFLPLLCSGGGSRAGEAGLAWWRD